MSNAYRQLRHVYYKKLYIVYYSNRPAVTSKSPSLPRSVPVARSRSRFPWEAIKKPRLWCKWSDFDGGDACTVFSQVHELLYSCVSTAGRSGERIILVRDGRRHYQLIESNPHWLVPSIVLPTAVVPAVAWRMSGEREGGFRLGLCSWLQISICVYDREKKLCSYVITKLALKLIEYFQKKIYY